MVVTDSLALPSGGNCKLRLLSWDQKTLTHEKAGMFGFQVKLLEKYIKFMLQ